MASLTPENTKAPTSTLRLLTEILGLSWVADVMVQFNNTLSPAVSRIRIRNADLSFSFCKRTFPPFWIAVHVLSWGGFFICQNVTGSMTCTSSHPTSASSTTDGPSSSAGKGALSSSSAAAAGAGGDPKENPGVGAAAAALLAASVEAAKLNPAAGAGGVLLLLPNDSVDDVAGAVAIVPPEKLNFDAAAASAARAGDVVVVGLEAPNSKPPVSVAGAGAGALGEKLNPLLEAGAALGAKLKPTVLVVGAVVVLGAPKAGGLLDDETDALVVGLAPPNCNDFLSRPAKDGFFSAQSMI